MKSLDTSESWKVIEDFPSYAVSNHGRVRRVVPDKLNRPMRELALVVNDKGYYHINLHKDGKQKLVRPHILVADAFIGRRPTQKHQVRHLDGNKLNNFVSNLCWGTDAENKADNIRHGVKTGPRRPYKNLSYAEACEVRALTGPHTAVARKFGVSPAAIQNIRDGKTHKRAAA